MYLLKQRLANITNSIKNLVMLKNLIKNLQMLEIIQFHSCLKAEPTEANIFCIVKRNVFQRPWDMCTIWPITWIVNLSRMLKRTLDTTSKFAKILISQKRNEIKEQKTNNNKKHCNYAKSVWYLYDILPD